MSKQERTGIFKRLSGVLGSWMYGYLAIIETPVIWWGKLQATTDGAGPRVRIFRRHIRLAGSRETQRFYM